MPDKSSDSGVDSASDVTPDAPGMSAPGESSSPDKAGASKPAAALLVAADDEDLDETLMERLIGLTEMFPESVRSATCHLAATTNTLVKKGYGLTRNVVWIAASSALILFAPVMFELERLNAEELIKQDRNRLVLGPGSAMSGAPGPGGLMPPPMSPPSPPR